MKRVYVLSAGSNMLKVGIARDIKARVRTIQTGCPTAVWVMCVITPQFFSGTSAQALEAELHRLLEPYRTAGGSEWFAPPGDTILEVIDLAAKGFFVEWCPRAEKALADRGRRLTYDN
jgi:hypothetical protein